ncbi:MULTISPECIES: hypothetical protein [Terrabacteria group]|uniref:hypothetical protein n=1 Tax=Bacillati TaxID=1783272 RepID=UPI001C6ED383|nr:MULTISPECIES: hypothetical protein [Terrabacteria group]MBW9211892.1 hypothetical protein [Trueperella sp. zg.1013]
MKKLLLFLLTCVLLGCSSNIHRQQKIPVLTSSNSNVFQKSYHFYIPSSIGRFESNGDSYVLDYQGTKFQMTFNLSTVLFDYKEPFLKKPQFKGEYIDVHQDKQMYLVSYEKLENQKYYLIYESPAFIGTSICEKVEMAAIVRTMVQISQSLQVDKKTLQEQFVKIDRKKYIADAIPFFEKKVAKEGRIEDLFSNNLEESEKKMVEHKGD